MPSIDPVSRLLFQSAGRRGAIALMYHSVEPGGGTPEWQWAVSQGRFEAQLDLLADSGWTTCSVSQLAAPETLPERSVAITFDDGYRDNLTAVTALAQRGMIATWYMVTRDLGSTAAWPGAIETARPMLDHGELREMQQAGMEIGAHTRSHPRLTSVTNTELADQIAGSRHDLEDILGTEVASFAYPYGDFDERVVEAVRTAGFSTACVTRSGWGRVDNDPLRIRRLAVFAEDKLATFARKMGFADNDASWARVQDYYWGRLRARMGA